MRKGRLQFFSRSFSRFFSRAIIILMALSLVFPYQVGAAFLTGGNLPNQFANNGTSIYYTSGNLGVGTSNPITGFDLQSGTFRQKNITSMVTDTLTGPATGAKRYEIARVAIDYNDWNSVGPIEVELYENYYSLGLKKKYSIYYGYTSNSGVYLSEVSGAGGNNFQVKIGSEVVVAGDHRYIPVYVDVRYYAQVTATIKTNRNFSVSNPPPMGYIWFNPAPTGSDISDFTADSTVYINNVSGFNSVFNGGNVGVGKTPSVNLDVAGAISAGSTVNATGLCISSDCKTSWAAVGSASSGWTQNGNEIYKTSTSGNVGIGTTAPGAKLHVISSGDVAHEIFDTTATTNKRVRINFAQNGVQNMEIATDYGMNNTADLYIYNRATTQVAAYFNPNGNVWFNPTGNVGVGITSPGAKLDVNGTSWFRGAVYADTINHYSGSVPLSLGSGGIVNILTGGNVGVGTASPNAKLSVSGTTRINGDFAANGTGHYFSAASTHYQPANDIPTMMIRTDDAEAGPENTLSGLVLYNANGGQNTGANITFASREATTGGNDVALSGIFGWKISAGTVGSWSDGGLRFWTKNGSGLVDAMAINNVGNIGVGKTNPGANLDVAGAISAGSTVNGTGLCIAGDCRASWAAAGSYWTGYGTNIGNNNAGNVGIGTTAPLGKLNIISGNNVSTMISDVSGMGGADCETFNTCLRLSGGTHAQVKLEGRSSGGAIRMYFDSSTPTPGAVYTTGAHRLGLGTNSSPQDIVIDSAHNVGIGTTAPATKLEVAVGSSYVNISGTGTVQNAPTGNYDHIITPRVRIGYMTTTNIGTIASNAADSGLSLVTHSTATGWKESLRVQPDGNVGIGIISPGYKLMVNGDIGTYNTNQIFARYTTNENYKASLNWYGLQLGNNGDNYIVAGRTNVNGSLNFIVNNTTDFPTINGTNAMRILSGGNVGIGKVPGANLDVLTSINAGSTITGTGYCIGASCITAWSQAGGGAATSLTTASPIYRSAAGAGYLNGQYAGVESTGTSGAIYSIGGSYVPGTTNLGNMYGIGYGYSGNAGITATGAPASTWGMYVASGGVSRIFLNSDSGNIYINGTYYGAGTGLTGTAASLTAGYASSAGSATTATSATSATTATTATNASYLNTAGLYYQGANVGVGTASPQKQLDAISVANDFVTVGANTISPGGWTGIHFGYRENNNLYRKSAIVFERTDNAGGGGNAAGKIHILNGPAIGSGSATLTDAKLTIGELGNVGIGVVAPGVKLDVNGAIRVIKPSTLYDGGIVTTDETSGTVWNLHMHGDRWRSYNGTAELIYMTTGDSVSYANSAGSATTAGSATNVTSLAGTWTGTNYFLSNLGATSGSLSSPPLQVYATGGNSAFMSFHRSGNYAVNIGLDSDNVLRIGGWSASANRWQLDMNGNQTLAGALITANAASTWGDIRTGSIDSNSVYAYNSVCVNNNSGTCGSTNGVVLGLANTSANTNFPTSGNSFVNNGGNFGVGTASPGYPLHLYKASSETGILTSWGTTNVYLSHGGWGMGAGKLGIGNGSVPTIVVDSTTNNLGVGIAAPTSKLHVYGGTYPQIYLKATDTHAIMDMDAFTGYAPIIRGKINNVLKSELSLGDTFTVYVNGANRITIPSTGNVGIGNDSPSTKLYVSGDVTASAYYYSSDRTLKTNIKTLDNSLDKILKLRGVSFDWKKDGKTSMGLIAQEVKQVYPELINGEDGNLSIQYGNLVAPLIESIKEQQEQISAQQSEIEKLKNRINSLEKNKKNNK